MPVSAKQQHRGDFRPFNATKPYQPQPLQQSQQIRTKATPPLYKKRPGGQQQLSQEQLQHLQQLQHFINNQK